MKCWVAFRDALPGGDHTPTIERAINVAEMLVLVLSRHAIAAAHVSREVERFCARRRQIIVFRIDNAPLNLAMDYFLSDSHWLDAQLSAGIRQSLPALLKTVRSHLETKSQFAPPALPDNPQAGSAGEAENGILVALWDCLDASLQDAFSIAYNKKRREGSRRISTKDFFQALGRVDDDAIGELFKAIPKAALPEPAQSDHDQGFGGWAEPTQSDDDRNSIWASVDLGSLPAGPSSDGDWSRKVLTDGALLSDCVSESLHRFGSLQELPRKLSPADVFVDIAKHGHGPSVNRLRIHGIGPAEIDAAVERSGFPLIQPDVSAAN